MASPVVNAPSATDRTRAIQRAASDPTSSAWVVANAGSGKTHVLTQRVIRLLLAGADPAAILCLTFTKVAAAQMSSRVFKTLGEWAMFSDAELSRAIEELQGQTPSADEMRRARRLFARALETPGGLKIQTVHAFCERLLHEFPFEANVPGQFAILDDNSARSLIADARAATMSEAAALPDSPLGRAMRHMAENAADVQIGEALDALIAERGSFRQWIAMSAEAGTGGVDDALADLRRRLGMADSETEANLCREICDITGWECEECGALAAALAGFSTRLDENAMAALRSIADARHASIEADFRVGFFLAADDAGGLRTRSPPHRFSAAFYRDRPGLREAFAAEGERLLGLANRLIVVRAYAATEALLVVGDAILQAYDSAKRQSGMLDFADLIAKTRNLLSRSDASAWVLYKLDRRIDHILVDEAQDTSPDQWAVVQAIAEDFFTGEGAGAALRTIFAVGDDKQSIFGFQGAVPEMLAEMRRFFAKRIEDAAADFVALPLFLSFRSTHEVLQAVDKVFEGARAGLITASGYEAHASHRPEQPGHIVILPRIVRRKVDEPEDWTTPFDAPSAAETELAQRIADEVLRLRNTILPSGKRLREGGILILVRKRDAFAAAMHRALRARQIPTAGADRIPVATHIAVLDLLALADVMLLPEDDMQLAACLKSPLVGMSEEALMGLATGRGGKSLWSALQQSTDASEMAAKLRRWRGMADQVTPFRFFAEVLGPDLGRRAFRARLGGEAEDILDTFLSQALAYETLEPPSLQGFVRFIRANESDIKRETEDAATGVRIMTVHGAKGLEADVVFLVDTGGLIVVPGQRDRLIAIGAGRDDPAFLWRRRADEAPALQHEADEREDAKTHREYLRLLYVAMTRARDVLYVAGIKGERTPPEVWYSLVENALVPDIAERDADKQLVEPYIWPQPPRPPLAAEKSEDAAEPERGEAPAWLFRPALTPASPPEPLRPSQALADLDPRPDFLRHGEQAEEIRSAAMTRARLVHLLLEKLPRLPEDSRGVAAGRLLLRELPAEPDLAESIKREAEAVLAHPELRSIIEPGGRSEVAIVGGVSTASGDFAVSGRIDYLARGPQGWHIVDFKTGRLVPESLAAADPAYILQLALYRRLLMEIEPGAEIRATIVWTAGPKLMPIPAETMEHALAKMGIAAIAVP